MKPETYRRTVTIGLPVGAIGLLVALHVVQIHAASLWGQTLLNSAHVLVFALIALLIYAGLSQTPSLTARHRFLITAAACIGLGAASEAAQINGPRDASFGDLALDYLGAAASLLFIAALKPGSRGYKRMSLAGVGMVLLGLALLPLISTSAAYIWRYYSFPVLISFDLPFVHTFVRPQNSILSVQRSKSGDVALISLRDGAWPGLIIHDLSPDWTGFDMLVIELRILGSEPLDVHLRVHDRQHRLNNQLYSDRFNTTLTLQPGTHSIRLSLDGIRNGPAKRAMDLARIDGLVIFCARKDSGRAFQLKEIRLE